MPTPQPSDRTTHPTPRTIRHSHAPRSAPVITGTYLRSLNPHDDRPAVWPDDLPLAREYRAHDGSYYPFTGATHLSSSGQTAPQINPAHTFRPHPRPKQDAHLIRPFFYRRNSNRNTLRLLNPLTPATSSSSSSTMTVQMPPVLPPRHVARPNSRFTSGIPTGKPTAERKPASPAPVQYASSIGWVHNLRKKRRPSEIFNMNFSFAAPSRRSPADHTPPVSPRSSFSSGSDSTSSPTEESFKRQRVDSSGSEAALGFPFGKPTPLTSTRGRDLGSSSNPPCESSSSSPQAVKTTAPRPQHITIPAPDPHPGRLVDFASPDYDIPAPLPSPLSEYKLRLSTEVYEDYMASTTRRRSSFPLIEKAMRAVRQESKMHSKLDKLETAASSSIPPSTIPSTTPSLTAPPAHRKSHQYTTSTSSTSSSMSWTPSTPRTPVTASSSLSSFAKEPVALALQRATSDPSTEAFLTHVRASLKKRESAAVMKWQDYPVFADEIERGFLDGTPL